MQRLAARCAECAFENPRGWVSCARCGALLGPRVRRDADADTGDTNTAPTVRIIPWSLERGASERWDPDEPTHVYKAAPATGLEAPATAPTWAHGPPSDARPIVGRDGALRQLEEAIGTALGRGSAKLIAIEGAPGCGKTLMLHRVSEIAARVRPNVSIHYAALRAKEDGPYAPFSRLLLERFGVTPASSPSVVRGEMARALADVFGDDGGVELAQLIGHVSGIPFPDGALLHDLQTEPQTLHERAVSAVAQLARSDSRAGPLVWLLDDLTRADDAAFAVLAALLRLRVPILLIATGSPPLAERVAALRPDADIDHVVLPALNEHDVDELARTLMPEPTPLPLAVVRSLLQRSGGNPRELVGLLNALRAGEDTPLPE
jgi:hypothetical protein